MGTSESRTVQALDTAWVRQKGIYVKHGAFYWVHKGKWHRLGRTVREANARRLELLDALQGVSGVSLDFLEAIFWKAKSRARRRGLDFTLEVADVERMWTESGGKCALTGLPMNESNPDRLSRRPYIPSLHRMDARQGYTPTNARLVCFAVNVALNAWGDPVFRLVADGYLKRFPITGQASTSGRGRTALASRRRAPEHCAPRPTQPSAAAPET